MAELLETLASYVPRIILRRLAENNEPIHEPLIERVTGASMYADISGFTTFTEELEKLPRAQQGAGAEALTQVVNTYFGKLIDLIHLHGGDIVKFTGDGLLALWPAGEGGETYTSSKPGSLREAVLRAAQCGLKVQKSLHHYRTSSGIHLSMRMGIGAGDIQIMHLGGIFNRWEFLVAGNPIVQTSNAERKGEPGDVILSEQALELIRNNCFGIPVTLNSHFEHIGSATGLKLESIREPHQPQPQKSIALRPEMEPALRPYIPQAILTKLDEGHSAWLSDLRRVTVLFIHLPELVDPSPDTLPKVQSAIRTLQKTIYRYEGSLNKLSVDDKGATFVAAMGLPPMSHANDPERGTLAGLSANQALNELGMKSFIGVTTGLTFCGVIGNSSRREYTMMGDTVNLSARLMQAAQDPITRLDNNKAPVLCDFNTHNGAKLNLIFNIVPPVKVKGKKDPITVFQPLKRKPQTGKRIEEREEWAKALVGRTEERYSLAEQLQALQRGGTGATFVIEGEAGIGKSRLVKDVIEQAEALGIHHLLGSADPIEQSSSYHAWRSIFLQLMQIEEAATFDTKPRHNILSKISDPELAHLIPLLDEVLKVGIPENEFTNQMEGQVRANNTRNLLVRLLQESCSKNPTILILEDAQWLDSASWALLLDVWQYVKPLLLVISTRSFLDAPPEEYTQIYESHSTQRLKLESLNPEETVDLVCRCLGISQIPETVIDLILEKAEGHPFYSQELAYSLRENQYLRFTNGKCELAPDIDLTSISFPDSIQGVIINRIDNLSPQEQLILKVASVIGRIFMYKSLHDIYPVSSDLPKLRNHLKALGDLNITPIETPDPNLTYIFKHIITQEVSYSLLPFSQRQELHKAAAEWFVHNFQEDLSPFYPLLAYHWSNAGDPGKAVDYFEKAGEEALRGGAYKEAVQLFQEALHWDQQKSEGGNPQPKQMRTSIALDHAIWERHIGEAYLGLGQPPASQVHIFNALASLGRPVRISSVRITTSLLWQLGKQVFFRIFPRNPTKFSEESRTILLEAARDYRLLTDIYFYRNENLPLTHAVLRTLNLSERVGPTTELAAAYANTGMLMGLIPLHPLARFYLRKARDTAQHLSLPAPVAYVSLVSTLYALGAGDWEQVFGFVEESISFYRKIGDQRRWGESLSLLAICNHYLGRYQQSIEHYIELYELGKRSGDLQQIAWGLDGQATNYLRIGDLDKVESLLTKTASLFEQSKDRAEETVYFGTLAVLRLYQRNHDAAWEMANRALEVGSGTSPVYSTLEGYAGAAEVFLKLWELNKTSTASPKYKTASRHACKALSNHAKRFPVSKPRALFWKGYFERLSGKRSKALRIWQKSLEAAQNAGMPYEEALAQDQIGRYLPPGDLFRESYQRKASEIYKRIGIQPPELK